MTAGKVWKNVWAGKLIAWLIRKAMGSCRVSLAGLHVDNEDLPLYPFFVRLQR